MHRRCLGRKSAVAFFKSNSTFGIRSWVFCSDGYHVTESPAHLVARYRALPFPSDVLGDCAENYAKPDILRDLDQHANDQTVGQLLLDILSDSDEYDLARIEAAKIVHLYIDESSPLERQLKQQVWNIFADANEDTLVRQHASQNICVGFGGDAELKIIERLLFDEDDDIDVRHGAFSYLRHATDSAFLNRLIPRLRDHAYWSKFPSSIPATEPEMNWRSLPHELRDS
jgi:hypothetical protein